MQCLFVLKDANTPCIKMSKKKKIVMENCFTWGRDVNIEIPQAAGV